MKQIIFRDKHFYILLAFFVACSLIYYFGELISLFGWDALRWEIFYTVHDPHRMLFLIPILYSSYYYRLRGAISADVISLLIFLPRAFLISPYPDATLRMFAFVIVATMLSLLTAYIFNKRDKYHESIDALKQSEEKSHSILEQLYDPCFEVDLAGNFTLVNDSACNNLGYSREELIGKNFNLTVPEEDAKLVMLAFNQVFRTGKPNKGFEHRILRKDGSTAFAETSISLQRNVKGKIIGFRSISRNITERKQAEDEVMHREAHLQSLVNILQYDTASVQDFLDYALDEAIRLTGSKIGYIYYYDEETKEFMLNTWSRDVMNECTIAEKKTQYQLENTGIWGEAVRQRKPIVVNDFQSPHPLKRGYPEGHAKLYKYLTVPIFMDNRIVAVVGVANKETDYTQTDVLQLILLMESVWKTTYSKQMESVLRQSEELYRSLFGNMLNGLAYCKMLSGQNQPLDFIYLNVNSAFEKQTGLKDVTGKRVSEVIPGIQESDPQLLETYGRVASTGIPETLETYLTALDMWFSISIYSPQKEYFVAIFDVITERKQAEEALRISVEKYRLLVENINDVFYVLDNQGNITYVSPVVERFTKYKVSDLVGKPFIPLIYPDDLPGLLDSLNRLVSGQLEPWEFRILDKDGTIIYVRTSSRPIYKDGEVVGVTALITDITERKKMEQKLEEMATHDYLTGLPNRVLLTDRFIMAAALSNRNKARLAVMSLDLDRFKSINDTLGHEAGDQVLKTVSARLKGLIRTSDTVARVGGDEFVLVMIETRRMQDATNIAQRILDSFAEPLSIHEHPLTLSTSIGIAIYPEDAEDLETLVKKSDAAMYYSKGHGRNQFKFFSDGDVRMGGDHRSGPPVRD